MKNTLLILLLSVMPAFAETVGKTQAGSNSTPSSVEQLIDIDLETGEAAPVVKKEKSLTAARAQVDSQADRYATERAKLNDKLSASNSNAEKTRLRAELRELERKWKKQRKVTAKRLKDVKSDPTK